MFNESANVASLHERLSNALDKQGLVWEWIVIDDHSDDDTFPRIREIARRRSNVKGVRFARNSGSHLALAYGLKIASGQCSVVLAADLQDPPELIPDLLKKWRKGARVVWAARSKREGISMGEKAPSRMYYWLMKHFVGLVNTPPHGADFFLLDHRAVQALNQHGETNVSILALISQLGFRQETVHYDKKARERGESGWTLEKKIKLLVDSIISFTYKPIRFMSYLGFLTSICGFLYAVHIILNALDGSPVEGWSSLMVVILVIGGFQMLMLGILGEYLWRTLDETRKRPRFLLEDDFGFSTSHPNQNEAPAENS